MAREVGLIIVVLGLIAIALVDYTAVLVAASMFGLTIGRMYWSPRSIGAGAQRR